MPAFDARESRTEAGMVTAEPAEVTASATRPPGFRIRWGWFLGCIASGLVAIVVGWSVAGPAGRMNYLAGVLANAGTTLLLVGIVAYRFLPVSRLPSVEFATINVSASRPGADPETMAATVAAPLERRRSWRPARSASCRG